MPSLRKLIEESPLDTGRVRRSTLKDQSYSGVRRALLAGRFEPGEQITVKQLSELLETGTMPMREAIQRLVAEGALVAQSTGRIFVPRLTLAEFEEIVELRLLLEPIATDKAVRRRVAGLADSLRALQSEITAGVKRGDPQKVLWANYRFHFALYSEAGAPVLGAHVESLWLRAGPLMINLLKSPKARALWQSDGLALHDELCDRVERGDAVRASTAMRRIIEVAAGWQRTSFPFADDVPTAPREVARAAPRARRAGTRRT